MVIYKVTNLINDKIYVGQNKKNNPNYYRSGKLIKRAVKKYGKDNFKKEILCECNSLSELNEKEIFWISELNSMNNEIGYNLEAGGSDRFLNKKRTKGDYTFTEEHKKNISKGMKGLPKNKKHKENISKNHHNVSGENNPMYGKNHTDEIKQFMSDLNTGKIPTKEQRQKMSIKSTGEQNPNSKLTKEQVVEIRRLYHEEVIFQNDLAKKFNVNQPCIYKIVNYKTWRNI